MLVAHPFVVGKMRRFTARAQNIWSAPRLSVTPATFILDASCERSCRYGPIHSLTCRRGRMKVRAGIEVSSQSDIGCVRNNNEDSLGYWEPEDDDQFLRKGRLGVVADGMGGYEGGQEASRLAVETLVEVYREFAGDDPQQALTEAMQAAHQQIRRYSFRIRSCAAWEQPAPRRRSCRTLSITRMSATRGFI